MLDICVNTRNANLLAYMLAKGVSVNETNLRNMTTLQYCHSHGLDKLVKLLIEYGADASTLETYVPDDQIMHFMNVVSTKFFLYRLIVCIK